MTAKNPRPLTQPRKGEPNHGKFCAQPGSLPVTDAPIQPSLAEQLGLKKTMDFTATMRAESMDTPAAMVIIHCPICGWQQEVEENMWKFQSSPVGHGYTCGSGKCPSHTAMVFGPAPFDHKACILCDHVIVQQVLGNKCKLSGALCCYMRSCPLEDRKKRETLAESKHPSKEYIITEDQLKKYEGLFFLDDEAQEDFKIIRSRQYVPAQPEPKERGPE